jgi:3-oxoadipate enol-lactonase
LFFNLQPITQIMPSISVGSHSMEYEQSGQGPDLLLVHSLLTEMTVFEPVMPALCAAHRVTRVNLPGFGTSSPVECHGLAEVADHLARGIKALDLPESTAIFGNGFGAFVVLMLVIRHPELVGHVMVADTGAIFPEAGRAPFRGMAQGVSAKGMGAVLDTAIGRMLPPAFQQAHPEVVAERKRRLGGVDAGCFARACLSLAEMDLRADLAKVMKPMLVMCGALDATTPPAMAREVAALVPGARYEEIAGSGHCPMLEQPQALSTLMLDFLRAGA